MPEDILLNREGGIGDLLMLTPALREFRAVNPSARIFMRCHPTVSYAMHGNPNLDGFSDSSFSLDRLIDLDGNHERTQLRDDGGGWVHPVLAYCRTLDVAYDGLPYDYTLTDEAGRWARPHLSKIAGDWLPVAAFVRSAMRTPHNWQAKGWTELAESLPDSVRLIAMDHAPRPPLGTDSTPEVDAVFYDHPRVVDLTGITPSGPSAVALLAQCAAYVGIDTGMMHHAHALSLPVVGLFAAAPAETRLPLCGPSRGFTGDPNGFITVGKSYSEMNGHGLDHIRGEDVAEALLEIMS